MQDVSLGKDQFGSSLELGLIDSDRQAECGNTLDGSAQDSPVEEEDDAIVQTGRQLNRIQKRSVEEDDLSDILSSRVDEVGRVEREAEESEEVEKRKFRGLGKRARELNFRGIRKRFRNFGNQILGKRKYSFKGMGKRDPWIMNEGDMAEFEKRRYKIRGVGKRKFRMRGVGKRRQYNFRGLFGMGGDRLGKRPFSFWGRADPRAALANRLYISKSQPLVLTEDRNTCVAKNEDFPRMARLNKFPMGKRWDGDTLRMIQTTFPNRFQIGLGDMK